MSQKVSTLTELTSGNVADADILYIVDASVSQSKKVLASSNYTYILTKLNAANRLVPTLTTSATFLNGAGAFSSPYITFPTGILKGANNTNAPTAASSSDILTAIGNIPVGNLNGGTGAGSTKFWRGDASWSQVALATDVTGNLAVARLGGGSNAGATTFWRGDGAWAPVTDVGSEVTSTNVALNEIFNASGAAPTVGAGAIFAQVFNTSKELSIEIAGTVAITATANVNQVFSLTFSGVSLTAANTQGQSGAYVGRGIIHESDIGLGGDLVPFIITATTSTIKLNFIKLPTALSSSKNFKFSGSLQFKTVA
jgi:hypothetical protein